MEIREVQAAEVEAVNQHLRRHIAESGRHGVHWLPFDPAKLSTAPTVSVGSLSLPTDKVGWQRWYALFDQAQTVVGHLSLKGARFDRGLHRCELGMGLEHPFRAQGWGARLVALAIKQATAMRGIDWLDLHVLSCNEPGIALYRKYDFQEISRVPDFCRIEGQATDDVFMSLQVVS